MSLSNAFLSIIQDYRMKPEGLPSFEARLFFEGSRRRPFLVRFSTLLFLSTIIASGGVLNDSTATVIGAMIIAPLMTPIMATTAALVMGNMNRARRSLLIVIFGVALVILVSWLVGVVYFGAISYTQNSQIVGRTSPRLADLIIALASGVAGAFAMSRDDIADFLPGVAIAISLVPPLCVVGISLSDFQWESANGAMRLFSTNFLSILLAGGGTLALLGLGNAAGRRLRGHSRRNAFIVVALATLLISVPLAATGYAVAKKSVAEFRTLTASEEWLSQTEYEVQNIELNDDEITVWIVGYGSLPDTSGLVSDLQEQIGREVVFNLEIIQAQDVQLELVPPDE